MVSANAREGSALNHDCRLRDVFVGGEIGDREALLFQSQRGIKWCVPCEYCEGSIGLGLDG